MMTTEEMRKKAEEADRKEAEEATRALLKNELIDLAMDLKRCTPEQMQNIADSLDAIVDVLRNKVRFGLME